jgi:CDP-paratose 2-epimerase
VAWTRIGSVTGQAFNLGGSPGNAVSRLRLLGHIRSMLGRPIDLRFDDCRQYDLRYFVADIRRARQGLRLRAPRFPGTRARRCRWARSRNAMA